MSHNYLLSQIIENKLPKHVAITTDGNGRWGKKHGKSRIEGHKKGIEAVRAIVEVSVEIKLEHLTFYAFSTENWKRPPEEVNAIFDIVLESLINEVEELHKNNVIVRFLGSRERISEEYSKKLQEVSEKTWVNNGLNLNIALNYGGRKEIIDAINRILLDFLQEKKKNKFIDEVLFEKYLYTKDIPDPDLLIRTSGEQRLSNFFIWQSAYSELFFSKTLWPDFTKEEFLKIIIDYQNRRRRFGDIR